MSEKKANNDELIFTQSTSVQERDKIKELWKFLDTQCNLQPFRPLQSTYKSSLQSCMRDRSCKLSKKCKKSSSQKTIHLQSTSSHEEEVSDDERIWYHGLRFFQQIGLDKAALCKDKCKFCLAEKDFQNTNYPDTISETYDELKAEMATFDERLVDHEEKTSHCLKN